MILRILFIFLFIVLCGFVLFFIYGIFIPAIKNQLLDNQDPLFSEIELNYVGNTSIGPEVKVSSNRAVISHIDRQTSEMDNRLIYNGIKNCALFDSIYDTPNEYSNVCLGFGDCVKVCPQEAIMIHKGRAVVTKNCCGCGKCINVCPKNIISLVPAEKLSPSISEQKYFKFWKSCYRIFHGK